MPDFAQYDLTPIPMDEDYFSQIAAMTDALNEIKGQASASIIDVT